MRSKELTPLQELICTAVYQRQQTAGFYQTLIIAAAAKGAEIQELVESYRELILPDVSKSLREREDEMKKVLAEEVKKTYRIVDPRTQRLDELKRRARGKDPADAERALAELRAISEQEEERKRSVRKRVLLRRKN